jgi:hypothetical protein
MPCRGITVQTLRGLIAAGLSLALLGPTDVLASHLDRYEFSAPRIELLVHGRELHAVDGSRIRDLRLMSREQVLWIGSANRLAVAVTDKRIIAITTHWDEWQTRLLGVHESLPSSVLAGDDFVLVVTDARLLGVSDHSGSFIEKRIGTYERVANAAIGEQVGLVLTDRRAIGFSSRLASLVEHRIGIHEDLFSARASYDFATVATSERLLLFDAPSGSWRTRQLGLR